MKTTSRLRFERDDDAQNPRDWCSSVSRMICFHSRYNLGDEHNYDSSDWKEQLACEADADLEDKLYELRDVVCETFYSCLVDDGGMDWRDANRRSSEMVEPKCEELIDRAFDAGYVALPLYLYDHGGITMNTGGFSCGWDSGCVGVIVCDQDTIDKEFGGDREKAERYLRAEVETYDHYLTGNVWGWIVEESDDVENDNWEVIDSCFGFYGCISMADCDGYTARVDYIDCGDCPVSDDLQACAG